MALSGTIKGSTSNDYISAKITWSATQSVSGNYSDVTATLYYSRTNTGYTTYGTWSGSITIDGEKTSDSQRLEITYNSNTKAITAKTRVYHNSDGTKSITISASGKMPDTSLTSTSISGKITLDTIARASSLSLSAESVNVGAKITANISRASSSFTHKVEFYIKGVSTSSDYYTLLTEKATTSASFTIPSSWYNYMSSSVQCTARCRITTYSGSTKIGDSVTKDFTVKVPSSIKPTIGDIILDPTNINNNNILVKGKNKLTIKVGSETACEPGKGSNIKSYTFSGPSISKTVSSSSTSASTSVSSVTDVSSNSFTDQQATLTYKVRVTDARGRYAEKTKDIICYDYYTPSLSSFKAYRANSDGTANINGTYLRCTYSAKYASVNSTNSATVTAYYNGETKTGSSGKVLINLNGDTDTTYKVYLKITDSYGGTSSTSTITVLGSSRVLNITSDGTGVAIGKMAESTNLFECRWPAKFDDKVTISGNIATSGNVAMSSSAAKTFDLIRTGMTVDADKDGTDDTADIKMQFYISDDGNAICRRRHMISGSSGYTTQGYLRLEGDNVTISPMITAPRGRFTATTDAAATAQNNVALRVGNPDGEHLDIDANEIVAKNGANTSGHLNFVGSYATFNIGSTSDSSDYVTTLSLSEDDTSKYVKSVPTYNRTYSGAANTYITSNGVFGRSTSSSQRYKTNISDVTDEMLDPYKALEIPVRQFKYNAENTPIDKTEDDIYIGFIAEEVEKIYPAAAEYNENGEVEMWNMKVLFPALFKIVQDQQKEIEELKSIVQSLTAQN